MSVFEKLSPLTLVSHWPDEDEKHRLIERYFNAIETEAAEIEDDLIVPSNILAEGAKHHMRKRAEQAARTAKQMHQMSNRSKAFDTRFLPKTLQDQTATNLPARRLDVFTETLTMPSIEVFAKGRVGDRNLESPRLFNQSAVRWMTSRLVLPGRYGFIDSEPETSYKIPSVEIDTTRNLAYANVTSKTVLARFASKEDGSPMVDLKARHVGVLPLDPDLLTNRERLLIGSLAFKRSGDLSTENLEEPKETLRQLVMRDMALSYEERLIEPSMMMLYVCRTGLGAARKTN